MKAVLQFEIPGEADKFVDAFNSVHWKYVVQHIVEWAAERQGMNGDTTLSELLAEIEVQMAKRNLAF